MTDILLTHSYHLPFDRKQVRKMQPYPPLGTLYAAAVLRQHGLSVAVFDTMLTNPAGFADAVRRHKPAIVVVYEDDFNFLTKMCLTRMREVCWQLLSEAKRFGATAIAHGSDATDHAPDYLARGFDYVVVGEAEFTLRDLVISLMSGGEQRTVAGLAFIGDDGHATYTAPRQPSSDLHQLPLPARDLIALEPYREAWTAKHGFYSMNLVASRGCPFRCNWCAKPIFGDAFHARPAADVAEEVESLKNEYHASHLWFGDDIFALNRHWTRDFAIEVRRRNCVLPFRIQARADLMNLENVEALKDAGCAEVWMGVESGSQRILDAMDKGLRVDEVRMARENLKRTQIRSCFFLQFGYPGETWDDIRRTVELVRETRPDDIGVSLSYPLPNTRFHDRVRQQLGAKQNWEDSDDLCVTFKGTYTDSFYRSIRDALHAEVDGWREAKPSDYSANLWKRIASLEPHSRNLDATFPSAPARTAEIFVPIGSLSRRQERHE